MSNVYPDDAMNEGIFYSLCEEIEEQVDGGISSRILIPDWQSFVDCVEDSKHRLVEDEEEAFLLKFKSDDREVEFRLRQTRYQSEYVDMAKGFGFTEYCCLSCGTPREDLLYDSEQGTWYCPICS
jgi:hypothetical protein